MKKTNIIQKRIICVVVTLVMMLALAPMLETTAEAAGHVLDLSNPPTANVPGVWALSWGGNFIEYLGAGPLRIRGSVDVGALGDRGITVRTATNITIENNTNFRTNHGGHTLDVPANSIITGLGSNITMGIISSDSGNITLNGTFGNVGGINTRYPAGGTITINGNLGSVDGIGSRVDTIISSSGRIGGVGGLGIVAGRNITIAGTVGNITGFGYTGDTSFCMSNMKISAGIRAWNGNIDITGTVGNISNVQIGIGIIESCSSNNIRLSGSIGRISAIDRGIFVGGNSDNIHISTPITVSTTNGPVFNRTPIIASGLGATWSNNASGTPIVGSGVYVWNSGHRWVSIAAGVGTPPPPSQNQQSGWVQSGGNWFFYRNNARVTGWLNDGGTWYFMHPNGMMAIGWVQSGDGWFFMHPNGGMATGWIEVGGLWFFMHPTGAMATGWQFIDGAWYFLHSNGMMATGWVNDGGVWYYMHPCGAMATGWVNDGGTWYYMHPGGAMATGWMLIGGVWHYFLSSGAWWGTY